MKTYPSWVEKHHTKGTSIKQIGNNYYLYSVTSKYDKNKGYPVSIQKYIGTITPDGLVKPETISFTPGKDKISTFKDIFDISKYSMKDRLLIENIPIIVINNCFYTGNISNKQISIINKHFFYNEGVIAYE